MACSSQFYCDICDVTSFSEEQLRSHLLGHRHWHNKKQRDVSQRSVYVRGLPPSVTKESLIALFEQFGHIHTIFLDDKGFYSIIEFVTVDSALSCLHCPQLTLQGATLTVKPRNVKLRAGCNKSKQRNTSIELPSDDSVNISNTSTMSSSSDEIEVVASKLHMKPDDVANVTRLTSLEDQIDGLSSMLSLSVSLSSHHQFLSFLQSSLQSFHGNCRVMPFGSMVTGLATPTSDLDVVVLTEWSPEDQFHFDENYYYFKTTTPSNDDPVPMDTESVTFTETQPPVTPTTDSTKVKICGSFDACDKDYKLILDMIASLPDLGDVLALPNARCPIIHFTHKQIKITCDLSINSRLGLYNTKLIKAYLDFDPRVPRLLHIIRAWARTINIKRTHLNNYALTLMLIYAMQRSTPPVLPSLQSPSFWPLNMEWIGKRGFTTATNSNDITVDGWMLQYNNPSSFMPSKNCMALSQLLYHFFHFYSAVFPYEQQVVAIHISANSSLTIADACSLAARSAPSSLPAKLRSLKSGFFCVQDPIELSHNVTKSMNFSSLKCLKDEMSKAHTLIRDMLENEQMEFKVNTVKFNLGIFKLFTACQNNDSTSVMIPKTPSKDCAILFFTLDKICKLLAKVPQFTDLSQSLYTYDKAYSFTLKCVVIQSLVFILENQLSFQCEAVPLGTEPANNDPVDDLSPVFVTSEEMVIINGQLPLMSVEGMNDRKRQRSNDENDSDEVDKNNDFKCNKLEDSICPLAHLLELSSSLKLHSYQCSAYCNTWTKIRQAKRLQARTGMTSSSMDSLSTHSPVLKFDVSCIEPDDVTGHYRKVWASNKDDYLVLISLKASEESMSEQFMTFFAYFKKLILL